MRVRSERAICLDEKAATVARVAAQAEGMTLDAWLSRAAYREAGIEEGLRGVAEWEAEHGALTDEDRCIADAVLDQLGVGRAR